MVCSSCWVDPFSHSRLPRTRVHTCPQVLRGPMWTAVLDIADRRAAGRRLHKGQLQDAQRLVGAASASELADIFRVWDAACSRLYQSFVDCSIVLAIWLFSNSITACINCGLLNRAGYLVVFQFYHSLYQSFVDCSIVLAIWLFSNSITACINCGLLNRAGYLVLSNSITACINCGLLNRAGYLVLSNSITVNWHT
jgi:hypothetical protein